MRRRSALVVGLAMAGALVPRAASAAVATSCSFDAGTATVTAVIGSGASPTLIRDGDAIQFGGLACGGATVTTTDAIQISDPDPGSGESLGVSLAGGRLVPGKTAEDDGTDEIEISADSYTGPFALIGSDVSDNFFVCAGQINLNNNVSGDTEISLPLTTAMITVDGGEGNDVLRTKSYQSAVSGGEGDDLLYPMDYMASSYDGGPGNDELSYSSQSFTGSAGEIHALGGGAATIDRGSAVIDSAQGFETFQGFDGPTRYFGSADADHFIGTQHNDWFLPAGGDDVIDGGGGLFDMFSTGASPSGVTFDMFVETATGEGSDTFRNIEGLQGSPNGDTFKGDPTDAGIIYVDGYGGDDVLDLSLVTDPQTVYLGPQAPQGALWAERISKVVGSRYGDHMEFTSGDVPARFEGRNGDDTLIGGPLNDVLRGGRGDDTIRGKRGSDSIEGDAGTDTCFGGTGTDTIHGCELP